MPIHRSDAHRWSGWADYNLDLLISWCDGTPHPCQWKLKFDSTDSSTMTIYVPVEAQIEWATVASSRPTSPAAVLPPPPPPQPAPPPQPPPPAAVVEQPSREEMREHLQSFGFSVIQVPCRGWLVCCLLEFCWVAGLLRVVNSVAVGCGLWAVGCGL